MPTLHGSVGVQDVPATHDAQVPVPLQTWSLPQDVPAGAFIWLHTGVPVPQEIVPGLHGVPHDVPATHDTQLPSESQTWPDPQTVPAAISV